MDLYERGSRCSMVRNSRPSDSHVREGMRSPQLLFVFCCFSVLAVTGCITVDAYSCVTAYWDTVSCVLHVAGNPSNATYSMKFTRLVNGENSSCQLERMNHSYYCDCKVLRRSKTFTYYTEYAIELCSDSQNCQSLTQNFTPSNHIQLTTPSDVKVQQTPEVFNFTWNSWYEGHRYISSTLDYDLLLEAFESNESKPFTKTLHCKQPEKAVSIPRASLKSYAKYCIKVRLFLNYNDGIWSKWGNRTCWENDGVQKETFSKDTTHISEKRQVILAKVLALMVVGFAVLLFIFYGPRMKIKTMSHTPSPAPFFQPLFQQYEGNLKDWLSPRHKCSIIYKTEELLTTDTVTAVSKPMKMDPEESLDFPSVTLPVSLCQTSYFDLPEMQKAPCPVTTVCPGNTSYTQLPCSVWEFNTEERQAVPSLPQESLENSCSDSGCSLESLHESPDCNFPARPAVESSPPFHCNDYCILNKTAEGVVPVLVIKGSSTNHASKSQQKEDES